MHDLRIPVDAILRNELTQADAARIYNSRHAVGRVIRSHLSWQIPQRVFNLDMKSKCGRRFSWTNFLNGLDPSTCCL